MQPTQATMENPIVKGVAAVTELVRQKGGHIVHLGTYHGPHFTSPSVSGVVLWSKYGIPTGQREPNEYIVHRWEYDISTDSAGLFGGDYVMVDSRRRGDAYASACDLFLKRGYGR